MIAQSLNNTQGREEIDDDIEQQCDNDNKEDTSTVGSTQVLWNKYNEGKSSEVRSLLKRSGT